MYTVECEQLKFIKIKLTIVAGRKLEGKLKLEMSDCIINISMRI